MGTCVLFRSRKTKVRTFAKTRRRRRRSRLNRVRWACCYGEILIVGNYHESDCSCFYAKDRQRTAFSGLKLLLLENVLPVTRWYQTVRTASTNCKWKAWEKKRRTTWNRDNLSTRNTAGLPFTGFSYMRCKNKYTRFLALVNNRTLRTISNSRCGKEEKFLWQAGLFRQKSGSKIFQNQEYLKLFPSSWSVERFSLGSQVITLTIVRSSLVV